METFPYDIFDTIISFFGTDTTILAILRQTSKNLHKYIIEKYDGSEKIYSLNVDYIARSKNMLNWSVKNGYKPTYKLCYHLVKINNFILLTYAKKHLKCPFDREQIFYHAGLYNNKEVIDWLMNKEIRSCSDERKIRDIRLKNIYAVCKGAAMNGNLEILKEFFERRSFEYYIDDLNCDIIIKHAIIGNQFETFKWLTSKIYYWNKAEAFRFARERKQTEFEEWILQN